MVTVSRNLEVKSIDALFAMRQQKLHGKGFSKIARSKSTDFSDAIAMACPNQQCWLSMSHALDNGDVDKAFVHLKKCSSMAAKFNKLRVVLISKRSQVRHTTLKKKVTTIIRFTCYGSVFEQCQETRRYTSDALRASSSISVDETD